MTLVAHWLPLAGPGRSWLVLAVDGCFLPLIFFSKNDAKKLAIRPRIITMLICSTKQSTKEHKTMKAITRQEILNSVLITPDAKAWALENLEYLNRKMKLFGSSVKVEKGEKEGYITYILYLQPHNKVSAKTLCPGAKIAGCAGPCLISSGQLGMSVGQNAATKRTILFLLRHDDFVAQLHSEIQALQKKHGSKLAIRLNGTSDADWHDVIAANPETRFYDYTKILSRVQKNDLPNYDLTFSGSAFNDKSLAITARAIKSEFRTVIAFNTKGLQGEETIPENLLDFDETDLRFLDPANSIGALKRKGSSRQERESENGKPSFFFTLETYNRLNQIIARG
ncbi:MAG: GP88 family protein [bacterium]